MAVETTEETIDETTGTGEGSESTPSLLDAISASLEATSPKAETPADNNSDLTSEGADDGSSDNGSDESDESDEQEGGETPERGADGKFKAGEKGKTTAGASGDGTPKPGEPKKADPVNDPIPEDIKGRTRERMTALIDTVKQKDEVIGNQNTIINAVKATGASPDEFAAMVSYMGWCRSDSKEHLTQARDMLLHELEAVSLKLGEAAPGVDFIGKHADLKAAVEAGQITQEAAQEIAIARTRTKAQADTTAAKNERDEATQRATEERNTAIKELDELGKTLLASDPDYAAKHDILEPILHSLGMLPPKQWRAAFLAAYKAVKLEPVRAPVAGGGATPKQQPLRANKSPSIGQTRKPTNLHEAMFGEGFPG